MEKLIKQMATNNKRNTWAILEQTIYCNNRQSIVTNLDWFVVLEKQIFDKPGIYNPLGIDQKIDLEEWPSLPECEEPLGILDVSTFKRIEAISIYATIDQMRPTMSAVYITESDLVATDAWMLRFEKHKCDIRKPSLFSLEVIKAFKPIFKAVNNPIELYEGKTYIKLVTGDLALFIRKIEGDYPQWQNVIPDYSGYDTRVTIPSPEIIKDLTEAKRVGITIHGVGFDLENKKAITQNVDFDYLKEYDIQVETQPLKESNTLVMPMRITPKDAEIQMFGISFINLKRLPSDTVYIADMQNGYMVEEQISKLSTITKPSVKPIINSKPTKMEAKSNDGLRLVKYSAKAIAVFGETKPVKDDLKALGGKFNPFLKENGKKQAGWIFSAKRREAVEAYLNN